MARVVARERFCLSSMSVGRCRPEQEPLEVIGRLGARLILQQALADEVTEVLGRA